jgi:beta-lactamase class C
MKKSSRLCLLFVLLCAGPSCIEQKTDKTTSKSEPAVRPPIENPWLDSVRIAYDRYFTDAMKQTHTPGAAVVLVQDSTVVFCKGYGMRSNGGLEPADAHTVFRIGSLSKGFASVLTGMLVQDGYLKWDDPVQKYFPEFALKDSAQARRVRIKHLLSHTTGLPYHAYTNLIEEGRDIRNIAGYLAKVKIFAKEGELFSYQNAAYSLIEEVMLGATGKRYPELLQEKIFGPAGMTSGSATYEAMMAHSNRAAPHQQVDSNTWINKEITAKYYNTAAAGGVNASIRDMGEWLKLLLGRKPRTIADSTLDAVFKPVILTHNERRHFSNWPGRKEAWYALGWRVLKYDSSEIVYHGGYVDGFRGEIAFDRREKIGICVLFNAASEMSGTCIPAFLEIFGKYKTQIRSWESRGSMTQSPFVKGSGLK